MTPFLLPCWFKVEFLMWIKPIIDEKMASLEESSPDWCFTS